MNITELSVNRPVTVVVITLLLVGLAAFMIPDLAVEMFPSTSFPMIMVQTSYTDASPEEVEESVTDRVENALSSLSGLESVSSTSSEGRSSIRLQFAYGTDLDEATNEIRDTLERVRNGLPDGASSPTIMRFNGSGSSIMTLIMTGDATADQLVKYAEDTVQPGLERIEGVGSVDVSGGESREIVISLSLNRLEAYGLSLNSVTSALRSQNILSSGGKVEDRGMEYSLRIDERYVTMEELRRTIITSYATQGMGGSVNRSNIVRLEDIADINIESITQNRRVYINGNTSVTLNIINESDTNTVKIAEAVNQALPEIKEKLPEGISVKILRDNTSMISAVLFQVYKSAIMGGVLAMLILLLFLRNIKSTLIIGISIPVSLLVTLGAMFFFDLTLNMISLTGLILGLGMIVDNSIVILENIFQYRERGAKLYPATTLGAREMVTAIVASTMTTLCVFIPMIIWKNSLEMIGQLFQDMIFTVVISLLASLIVALMLVPALSSKYLKLYSRKQKPLKSRFFKSLDGAFESFFTGMEKVYSKALRFSLKNRALVLTLVMVMFLLSIAKFSTMGLMFQPRSNADDSITIDLTMPIGTSLDSTESVIMDMRRNIEKEIQGYEDLIITVGGGGWGVSQSHRGSIQITLPDLNEQIDNPASIKEKLNPYLTEYPGAEFEFSSGWRFGSGNAVDVEIRSENLQAARTAANEIREILRNIPQVVDPVTSMENGAPEYKINIDKDRVAAMGLSVSSVASAISSYVNGMTPMTFWYEGEELNVKVKLQEEDRRSLPNLASLFIMNNQGRRIPLASVSQFELVRGPVDIQREEGKRILHASADIAEGSTSTIVNGMVQQVLESSYVPPAGVTLDFGGEARDINRIGKPLILVLIIAIIMVFAVMASLFESFTDPFIIFFSIPLLFIGVVLVYTLLGESMSMISMVGMVVLVGIVVNNGIVLVDYTNLLRKKGMPLMDACKAAGKSRLRPVLMTSLTTILGMVPLGFFPGEGTEMIRDIGRTIVGGLVASTFLTLFVTPIMYSLVNRDKKKREQKKPPLEAQALEGETQ